MLELAPATGETYGKLVELASELLMDANASRSVWQVLISSDVDSKVRRGVGFWRRFRAEIDPPAAVAEAQFVADGRLVQIGASLMPAVGDLVEALTAPWRTRFRRVVVCLHGEGDIEEILEWVASAKDIMGHRLVAHLMLISIQASFCVLMEEETMRHSPSIDIYGPFHMFSDIVG